MEQKIRGFKNAINTEREKILMLKTRYTSKLDEKNELEKIMRECIGDYKDALWDIKAELKRAEGSVESNEGEMKLKQTAKAILDKEKKLALLYDKIFHSKPLQKGVDNLGGDRF